jgi:hypothetical protein
MDDSTVCPESTLESANRRGFIRKAAIATAAAGIGSSLLGKNLVPDSSAKSSTCSYFACNSVYVDRALKNNGNPCDGYALYFGFCAGVTGILSAVTSGSPNQNGLDFFTNRTKRVSITKCGKVGIGTCCPGSYAFNVNAPNQDGVHIQGPSSCVGAALSFQTNGCCSQGWEILDTGVKAAQGSNKLNIRNLTTVKDVFTICGPNSFIGINNTAPCSPLCVHGTISGTCSGCGGCGVVGIVTGPHSIGVTGLSYSTCGYGVAGAAFENNGIGVEGTGGLIGVHGQAYGDESVPIVAQGNCGQIAPLQQWGIGKALNCIPSLKVLSVVNSCGWLGLGRPCAPTTLAVKGSVSANIVSPSGAYSMSKNDYAVLASANVTLPPANTAAGMLVFIKSIVTSAVTVYGYPTNRDEIEGKQFEILTKKYDSLTLISDGNSPGTWYIQSNAK